MDVNVLLSRSAEDPIVDTVLLRRAGMPDELVRVIAERNARLVTRRRHAEDLRQARRDLDPLFV